MQQKGSGFILQVLNNSETAAAIYNAPQLVNVTLYCPPRNILPPAMWPFVKILWLFLFMVLRCPAVVDIYFGHI